MADREPDTALRTEKTALLDRLTEIDAAAWEHGFGSDADADDLRNLLPAIIAALRARQRTSANEAEAIKATALTARDTPVGTIRAERDRTDQLVEALRRLAIWIEPDYPCWCDDMPDREEHHEAFCLNARRVLAGGAE